MNAVTEMATTGASTVSMLCGLGAVVWASAWKGSRAGIAGGVAAFVVALAWAALSTLPGAEVVGLGVAAVAFGQVVGHRWMAAAPALSGLLAGIWAGHLVESGMPLVIATGLAIGGPLVAARTARTERGFAPPRVLDEALLFVAVLGLAVATTPSVLEGWRAATTLNLPRQETAAAAPALMPAWALTTSVSAFTLGALYSLWRRR